MAKLKWASETGLRAFESLLTVWEWFKPLKVNRTIVKTEILLIKGFDYNT